MSGEELFYSLQKLCVKFKVTRGQWPYRRILVFDPVLKANFDLIFKVFNLHSKKSWYVRVCCHFGGLWGHGGLHMTSEVTYDLRLEVSDLNYLYSCASLAL